MLLAAAAGEAGRSLGQESGGLSTKTGLMGAVRLPSPGLRQAPRGFVPEIVPGAGARDAGAARQGLFLSIHAGPPGLPACLRGRAAHPARRGWVRLCHWLYLVPSGQASIQATWPTWPGHGREWRMDADAALPP